MYAKIRLFNFFLIAALALFTAACQLPLEALSASQPTATPYPTATAYPTATPYPTFTAVPTYTLQPTQTPYPTYTPYPEPTEPEAVGVGDWVDGHFFSVKVTDTRTESSLDGESPDNGMFLVVTVDWKTNSDNPSGVKHRISGADFELLLDDGERVKLGGMIYDERMADATNTSTGFQPHRWVSVDISGKGDGTYNLVFDVEEDLTECALWFRNYPLVTIAVGGN